MTERAREMFEEPQRTRTEGFGLFLDRPYAHGHSFERYPYAFERLANEQKSNDQYREQRPYGKHRQDGEHNRHDLPLRRPRRAATPSPRLDRSSEQWR